MITNASGIADMISLDDSIHEVPSTGTSVARTGPQRSATQRTL
ncbi:hypothetical protein [Microbacterium aerolatum]|nr:hypothetical protein [Microbacterium aerolatum]